MKFLAANLIGDIFARIAELEDESELGSSALDRMMKGFCPENSPINVYLLGYHTCSKPDPSRRCDMPGCCRGAETEEWKIIEGCGHSFHQLCLSGKNFCQICQNHIENKVEKLAKAANSAIFELNSKRSCPKVSNNDNNDGLPRVKDVTPKWSRKGCKVFHPNWLAWHLKLQQQQRRLCHHWMTMWYFEKKRRSPRIARHATFLLKVTVDRRTKRS